MQRTFDTTVEKLWETLKTNIESIDERLTEIREAFTRVEKVFKVGIIMTGEIREYSESGHVYDAEGVSGERLTEVVKYIERTGNCKITTNGNTITNISYYVD